MLSEDSCLLEGLQSADKTNAPKSKVTKRTHFYWKRKPLSCLFTFGNTNKNGLPQRNNRPIPIIGKTADNRHRYLLTFLPSHVDCVFVHTVNVKKWEDTVAEDERELEKLKKDENKQLKVLCCRILE